MQLKQSDPLKYYNEKFGANMIKYTIAIKKDQQLAISIAIENGRDENDKIKVYNFSENQSQVKQIVDGTAIVFEINTDAEDYASSDWQLLVTLLNGMTHLRHVIFVGPDVSGALIKKLIELLAGRAITFLGFVNCTEMQEISNITESLPNVKYLLIGNSNASVVASVPYHFDHDKLYGLVYLGIIGTHQLTFTNYEYLLMNNSLKEGFDYLTTEMEKFDEVHNLLTHADHCLSVVHFQYKADGQEIEYDRSDRTYEALHKEKVLLTLKTTNIAKVNELIAAEGANPTISFKNAATISFGGLKDMVDFDGFKKACETLNPFKIEVIGVGENAALPTNAIWNARGDFNTSKQLVSMELSSSADKTTADYMHWSKGLRTTWTVLNRSGLEYTLPTDGDEATFQTGNITNKESQDRIVTALTKNNPKYLHIAQDNGTLIEEIEKEIRAHKQMVDKIPFPNQEGLTTIQKASIMIWSKLVRLDLECYIEKVDVTFWFELMMSMKNLNILVNVEPEQQYLQDMGGQIAKCISTGRDTQKTNKIIIKCEKPVEDKRNASIPVENGIFEQLKNLVTPLTRKSAAAKPITNDFELEEIGEVANK